MISEIIVFPLNKNIDWKTYLINKIKTSQSNNIEIDCLDWSIKCKDILEIKTLFTKYGVNIISLKSTSKETVISAKSLGLTSNLYLNDEHKKNSELRKELCFHQGTIRSGEHIDSEGDLLVLGDVNPGGMVSAVGDVMVWGRLLGVAHSGKNGNIKSQISALHLRPVQLRIADKVAKGPSEKQEAGLAEQAEVVSGLIVIKPLTIKK